MGCMALASPFPCFLCFVFDGLLACLILSVLSYFRTFFQIIFLEGIEKLISVSLLFYIDSLKSDVSLRVYIDNLHYYVVHNFNHYSVECKDLDQGLSFKNIFWGISIANL